MTTNKTKIRKAELSPAVLNIVVRDAVRSMLWKIQDMLREDEDASAVASKLKEAADSMAAIGGGGGETPAAEPAAMSAEKVAKNETVEVEFTAPALIVWLDEQLDAVTKSEGDESGRLLVVRSVMAAAKAHYLAAPDGVFKATVLTSIAPAPAPAPVPAMPTPDADPEPAPSAPAATSETEKVAKADSRTWPIDFNSSDDVNW